MSRRLVILEGSDAFAVVRLFTEGVVWSIRKCARSTFTIVGFLSRWLQQMKGRWPAFLGYYNVHMNMYYCGYVKANWFCYSNTREGGASANTSGIRETIRARVHP